MPSYVIVRNSLAHRLVFLLMPMSTLAGMAMPPPAPACPKCGISKISGGLSCCAFGGAWFQKCGNPGVSHFDHTWEDGIGACARTGKLTSKLI